MNGYKAFKLSFINSKAITFLRRYKIEIGGTLYGGLFLFLTSLNLHASYIDETNHFGDDFIITQDTEISNLHTNIRLFKIDPGVTVSTKGSTITSSPWDCGRYGSVEIYASTIAIYGKINGVGSGFIYQGGAQKPGYGPGLGQIGSFLYANIRSVGAGGAGHSSYGGRGGIAEGWDSSGGQGGSSYGASGLNSYPISSDDITLGSSGGGFDSMGGSGGGAVVLSASSITINLIDVSASNTKHTTPVLWDVGGGGGGSGGTILIDGYSIFVTSGLYARGSAGDYSNNTTNSGGGGGSGGRVKIFYRNKNIPDINVSGGLGGASALSSAYGITGGNGTIYYNQKPNTPTLLSPSSKPIGLNYYPIFDWTDSMDVDGSDNDELSGDGSSVTYELEVSTNSNFNPVFVGTNPSTSVFSSTKSLSVGVVNYWHVRAFDGETYTTWTDPWAFTLDSISPNDQGVESINSYISSIEVVLKTASDLNSGLHSQPYWTEMSSSPQFLWISTSSSWQSSTTWVATGLEPGITYYARTKARDAANNETVWTDTTAVQTLLPNVQSLMVSLLAGTSIQLSWTRGLNGLDANYRAEVSTSLDFVPTLSSVTYRTEAWLTSLALNQTYYYRVVPELWSGYDQVYVSSLSVTRAAEPIANDYGSISKNSIQTRWSSNGSPAGTNYFVELSTDSFLTVLPSAWQTSTSFSFTGLLANTTYYGRVKARNYALVETEFVSLGSTATLTAAPGAPVVMSGYYESEASVGYYTRVFPFYGTNQPMTQLAIQETAGGEYLQGDGSTNAQAVWKTKTEWESSTLVNAHVNRFSNQNYSYRVKSRNFGNLEDISFSASASIKTPPSAPGISVAEINHSGLQVNVANVDGAEKYYVYAATWSGPVKDFVQIATISALTFTEDVDGGTPETPAPVLKAVTSGQMTIAWNSVNVTASALRYYRVAGVDNAGHPGKKSDAVSGAVSPIVSDYGVYKDRVFISSTSGTQLAVGNLLPNASYQFSVAARSNEGFVGSSGFSAVSYTLAETPGKPAFGSVSASSVRVKITEGNNPTGTKYAVYNAEFGQYLSSSGTLRGSAGFYTVAEYGGSLGALHSGLSTNSAFTYSVQAENFAGLATELGAVSEAAYTLPDTPVINSSSHKTGEWSKNANFTVTATGADHYFYALDPNSNTTPSTSDTLWNGNATTLTLSEGNWYLHVLGTNVQNLSGGDVHYGPVKIDLTAPTGTRVSSVEAYSSSITVTLTNAVDVGSGLHAQAYYVEVSSSDQFSWVTSSSGWTANASWQTVGLTHGTTYYARVKSRDGVGNESGFSASVMAVTEAEKAIYVPATPVLSSGYDEKLGMEYFVRIVPGYGENNPQMFLAVQVMDSLKYLQGNGSLGDNPVWKTREQWESGSITNVDGNKTALTDYSYRVYAKSIDGIVNSTPSALNTVRTPPTQPAAPSVSEVNDDALKVGISYVTGGEKYWVYYATYAAAHDYDFVQVATITPSATTYLDNVTGTAPGAPIAAIDSVSAGSISVSWTETSEPGASEPRYYRYSAVDNLGQSGKKSALGIGASKVTPITQRAAISVNGTFRSSGTINPAIVTNLNPNTSYDLGVKLISNEDQASAETKTQGVTLAATPGKPFGLNVTTSSIQISFSANHNPVNTQYEIINVESGQYLRSEGNIHQGLASNTGYTYQVRAINMQGVKTEFVSSDMIYTLAGPGTAGASNARSINSLQFSWGLGANASDTQFVVEVSTDRSFGTINRQSALLSSTYAVVASLEPNTLYWGRVKAKSKSGTESEYVDLSSQTTLALAPIVTPITPTNVWLNVKTASFTAERSDHFHYKLSAKTEETLNSSDPQWDGSLTGINLPAEGDWYLHVRGDNSAHEESGQSCTGPIKLDWSAPTPPAPALPAVGAVIINQEPQFTWTESQDKTRVLYTLEISTSAEFTATVVNKIALNANTFTLDGSQKFADMTAYYWRTRALDEVGNIGNYSATSRFFTDFGPLEIVARDTFDLDNDGFVEAARLLCNVALLDESVDPRQFILNDEHRAKSFFTGPVANDNEIYLIFASTFSADSEPLLKYTGNTLRSVSGKLAGAENRGTAVKDKVGPMITGVRIAANLKQQITIVSVQLSETVPAGEVTDVNRWTLVSDGGVNLLDYFAGVQYNPAQRIVRFTLTRLFPDLQYVRASMINMHDSQNNGRSQSAKESGGTAKLLALNAKAKNGGKFPSGVAVGAGSEVTIAFEQEVSSSSLQSNLTVTQIEDSQGNTVSNAVSGTVELSSANTIARFVPTSPFAKGSKFRVTVGSGVTDSFGFELETSVSWEFRTVMDRNSISVYKPNNRLSLKVSPGTFSEEAGLKVMMDPENSAVHTDKKLITHAIEFERNKARNSGANAHYPMPEMMFEVVGEKADGSVISGQLSGEVTLSMNYKDADENGILDGTSPAVSVDSLEFYHLNEFTGEFERARGTVIDQSAKTVSVRVNHFSVYAVMGAITQSVKTTTVWPNPWDRRKTAQLKIDNLPDGAVVDIYIETGQKVTTIYADNGTGIAYWDGTNSSGGRVAPGIYFVQVIAQGDNQIHGLEVK